MLKLILPLLLLTVSPAHADDDTLDDVSLIETYTRADNTCRGSSGDDPRTIMACDIRDAAGKLLEARGFVYDEESWQAQ